MIDRIKSPFQGMRTFLIIWGGQLLSLLGTAMTRFALLIWAYQQTGNATTIALLGFFAFASYVVVSPVAGVWVDRWDRRKVMIFSDCGAGIMTLGMFLLYAMGDLQIWHLYVAETLTGVFEAFQLPAYIAATSLIVPKSQYGRASGMRTLAFHSAKMIAPFLGGLLLTVIDIHGVMLIDLITFGIAMVTLSIVRIPRPILSADGEKARGNLWQEITFGFRYIFQRKGLLGLLLIMTAMTFTASLTYLSIMPAMILARTGEDKLALASVESALGIGGVIGGVLVSVFGLPKRKIHAFLTGTALSFFFGDFLFAIGRGTLVWIFAALVAAVFIPILVSANRAIWQAKVAPDVQGRVFAVQGMVSDMLIPFGYLMAGPLADHVFEPGMAVGGKLAGTFGWLVGTGHGAGMGLMFVCTCLMGTTASLSGYLFRSVRRVETELPDHDAAVEIEEEERILQPEMAFAAAD